MGSANFVHETMALKGGANSAPRRTPWHIGLHLLFVSEDMLKMTPTHKLDLLLPQLHNWAFLYETV